MTTPDPKGRAPNPITCVTTWLGSLFRGPTPRYLPAPPPPAPEVAPEPRLGAVARVAIDPGTPEALAQRNKAETAKWAKAIRDAKIEQQ